MFELQFPSMKQWLIGVLIISIHLKKIKSKNSPVLKDQKNILKV